MLCLCVSFNACCIFYVYVIGVLYMFCMCFDVLVRLVLKAVCKYTSAPIDVLQVHLRLIWPVIKPQNGHLI